MAWMTIIELLIDSSFINELGEEIETLGYAVRVIPISGIETKANE